MVSQCQPDFFLCYKIQRLTIIWGERVCLLPCVVCRKSTWITTTVNKGFVTSIQYLLSDLSHHLEYYLYLTQQSHCQNSPHIHIINTFSAHPLVCLCLTLKAKCLTGGLHGHFSGEKKKQWHASFSNRVSMEKVMYTAVERSPIVFIISMWLWWIVITVW